MKELHSSISARRFPKSASWLLFGVLLVGLSLNAGAGCPDTELIRVSLLGAPEEMTVGEEVSLGLSYEISATHRLSPQSLSLPETSSVAVLIFNEVECVSVSFNDSSAEIEGMCASSTELMALTLRALAAGTVRVTYYGCARNSDTSPGNCEGSDSVFVDIRVVNPGDELCANMADDDGDGMVDCADTDCAAVASCVVNMNGQCNSECNFDNMGPDESRAGAICDIMFPGETDGGASSQPCTSDADCDDGNSCTNDNCVGAFVFVCEYLTIDGCESTPQVRNGDAVVFEFDHTIVSLTVNGQAVPDLTTWIASGLSAGMQTLRIDWQNRVGADPASGCHEIEILVVP